jgi:AraC family transcriptional regulator
MRERPTPACIEKVVDYINANLDGNLSLATLAAVVSFSPFHFHRQFTSYTGISIARLVRLLRLRRAALKLAFNPELTITEIAFESGFDSTESFSTASRRRIFARSEMVEGRRCPRAGQTSGDKLE